MRGLRREDREGGYKLRERRREWEMLCSMFERFMNSIRGLKHKLCVYKLILEKGSCVLRNVEAWRGHVRRIGEEVG